MEFKFALGQKVKERFTGFVGVIVAQTRYLNGCLKYGVSAINLDKDGKIPDWEWIDETQLETEGSWAGESIADSEKVTGGPQQNAPEM